MQTKQPIISSFETSVEKVTHLKPFLSDDDDVIDFINLPCEWTGSVVVCCLLPVVINRSVYSPCVQYASQRVMRAMRGRPARHLKIPIKRLPIRSVG